MQGQKNGRIVLLSKCAVCDSKKSKFIKEQEARGLLSSLGIKTPLSNFFLINNVLKEYNEMKDEIKNLKT